VPLLAELQMADIDRLIRQHLGQVGLAHRREEEILRELSDHLEDHAVVLEASGMVREDAVRKALDSVSDWPALRSEILLAETGGANMNYRTKVLWLPALGALTLSSALLALCQFSGVAPHFVWVNMNLQPYFAFYTPWLIALPFVGAVGAFWSQRMGGKIVHRLFAALAPAVWFLPFLPMPVATLLVYVVLHLLPHRAWQDTILVNFHAAPLMGIVAMLVSWVFLPAVGLLLGAAPFLRKPQAQS
jgi:hypothetical protein